MADEADTDTTVSFDGQFDPDRAARLIAALRDEAKTAKAKATQYEKAAQERVDAEKTELQKAVERAERAEARAAVVERDRTRAATLRTHGLDEDLAEFLGDDESKFAARAEALAARLGLKAAQDAIEDEPEQQQQSQPVVATKPKARLTPGHRTTSADGSMSTEDAMAMAERLYNNR